MSIRTTIIPCLRYDDAPGAILFLCDSFGFRPQAIYADDEDQQVIHHAQLVLDGNMIMLSSHRLDETSDRYRWKTPAEAGGITQCLYVLVADIDRHHARAVENGAEIVTAPHDNDGYPGRSYDARDIEGHVWSFGSYDPFAPPALDA